MSLKETLNWNDIEEDFRLNAFSKGIVDVYCLTFFLTLFYLKDLPLESIVQILDSVIKHCRSHCFHHKSIELVLKWL